MDSVDKIKILAVIPARGGSKGIPRKNLALLGGRPLIAWTIAAAKAAHGLDRVIVSTDDAEIAAVAVEYGAEVPFLRPTEFSNDYASAHDVIKHALDVLAVRSTPYDAVAYLQPTSPFRTALQLSAAIDLFNQQKPDTLVSVIRVPHNMASGSTMQRVNDSGPLIFESPVGQKLRRQEKETLFARNGPAVLISSAADVLTHGQIYGKQVLGFEMDRLSSIDIDDQFDLEMARCLLPLLKIDSTS